MDALALGAEGRDKRHCAQVAVSKRQGFEWGEPNRHYLLPASVKDVREED